MSKHIPSRVSKKNLQSLLFSDKLKVGVIGLGYVGLPLIRAFISKKIRTVGFDIDQNKIAMLKANKSYIQYLPSQEIEYMNASGLFDASNDFSELRFMDVIIICVPTPLTPLREPDLSYVISTTNNISDHLRPGQLVVLESTTYPGTTNEVVKPILEKTGLTSGSEFFLSYSPEREDPGNSLFASTSIPKLIGADGKTALDLTCIVYNKIFETVIPLSSMEIAEAAKLTENIFRSVNIALINELKMIYAKMGINIWDIIDAAKTKPFGFMPFYPGPGLGGHCIPIDPFYLSWKAKNSGQPTRFIELAGEINSSMPNYVISVLNTSLKEKFQKDLSNSHILIIGISYKKDIDDIRETPAFPLIEILESKNASVDFYDPFIKVIPKTRDHLKLHGRRSIQWDLKELSKYSAIIICTDHSCLNYEEIVRNSILVIDTRNATKLVTYEREKIILA